MKRTILLSIFFVIAYLSINAQIKTSITGGLDFAKVNLKSKNQNDIGIFALPGYHFGMEFKLPAKENLSITTGLIVSKKGFKQSSSIPFRSAALEYDSLTTLRTSSYHIEIPILIEFKSTFDKINVLCGVGPYLSYGFAGEESINISSYYINYDYSEKMQWKPYSHGIITRSIGQDLIDESGFTSMRRLDYGTMIRLGVELRSFTLNAEYKHGLSNLLWEYRKYEKMNSESIGLSIIYNLK